MSAHYYGGMRCAMRLHIHYKVEDLEIFQHRFKIAK